MIAFLSAGIAMTLVAVALVVVPLFREKSAPAPVAALMAAVSIPVAVLLLYATISSYPWTTPATGGPAAADTPEIGALRARVKEKPDDAGGWVKLGEAYFGEERYAEARDAYRNAVRLTGNGNQEYRLGFAEASILADRGALTGEAGKIVEEVLSVDPANAKALWYGGMAALGRGDTAAARERWSRLLALSPPPRVRQILEEQLARLGGGSAPPAAPPSGGPGQKIPVHVSVKAELSRQIRPGAALFLIARAPGGAGPPLAVVRRDGVELPIDLEISDADSMVPGRSMGGLAQVQITARMANDGEALPAPGDVYGEVLWGPGAGPAPLTLVMDRVVP